ncbi:protein of unknown function [Verrucomicrobium sp. GAS474]|uniref:DUF5069 domain-containing protein n=1 Tax=Verrucomicrobium sp. GAS474 TaxID=1882831 RepID=UPI00087AED41|nr:DUF5069 domain-containing protein [Verrucomicrobium sp. GAS474]SDT96049.1 protein of unknown function [Verrucomicrobium sp. GAS474]
MTIPLIAPNLTKQPPHSPRERLAGFVIARRTLDKCRADLAGMAGEYHYDCPLDRMLFSFKGIDGKQFREAVRKAKSDEEVGSWLVANGKPRTPLEIKEWSDHVEASRPIENPKRRQDFSDECEKLGLDPGETTLFDWLEADDRASFKAFRGFKPFQPKGTLRRLIFNS